MPSLRCLGFFLILLVSCRQQTPVLTPIGSAPIRDLYQSLEAPSKDRQLPDLGTRFNLILHDQTVEKILSSLAKLGDFPLGFDDETNLKAQRIHMSLIAFEAPLETLLNFCAQALETKIYWEPQEPLVWVGNEPPPDSQKKRFHAWPLQLLLSEFQILYPREDIVFDTDPKNLDKQIAAMRVKIREEESKNVLPELIDFIAGDPILSYLNRVLEETDVEGWAQNWVNNLSKNVNNESKKIDDNSKKSYRPLIEFILSDPALENLNSNLDLALQKQWSEGLASFLVTHWKPKAEGPLKSLNIKQLSQNNLSVNKITELYLESLKQSSKEEKLEFYREVELNRKIKIYQEKLKQRANQILSPVRSFVRQRETRFSNTLKQLRKSNQKSQDQIENYLNQRNRESAQIISLAQKATGSSDDLSLFKKGDLILGSFTSSQAYAIDALTKALTYPQDLEVRNILNEFEDQKNRFEKRQKKLVSHRFEALPLSDVLQRWALEAKVTLAWINEKLPQMGQSLVNTNSGLLPFDTSLKILGKQYALPPVHDAGDGCLWIGQKNDSSFSRSLPEKIHVFKIPPSLSNYSADYLADYFKTILKPTSGFIEKAPPENLIVLLPRKSEEEFLVLFSQAALKGKLPKITQLER